MSHMEFLLPYMTNAERDTNVTPRPDISTSFEETANTDVSRDSADTITAPKKRKTDEIIHNDEDLLNFLKDMDDNRAKRTAQRDELRKEVLTSSDPLKAFFDSMYHSTKQMPEYYQRTIKRKLFQLVMDAEDNIANTNYSYTGYYSNDYSYNSRPSTRLIFLLDTVLPHLNPAVLVCSKLELENILLVQVLVAKTKRSKIQCLPLKSLQAMEPYLNVMTRRSLVPIASL